MRFKIRTRQTKSAGSPGDEAGIRTRTETQLPRSINHTCSSPRVQVPQVSLLGPVFVACVLSALVYSGHQCRQKNIALARRSIQTPTAASQRCVKSLSPFRPEPAMSCLAKMALAKSTLLRVLAGLADAYAWPRVGPWSRTKRCPRRHRLHEPRAHALRRTFGCGKPDLLRQSLWRRAHTDSGSCTRFRRPRPRASTAPSANTRRACASARRSPASCSRSHRCCCSTSPSPIWMQRAPRRCSHSSATCRDEGRTVVLTTHQPRTRRAHCRLPLYHAGRQSRIGHTRQSKREECGSMKTNAARILDNLGIAYQLRDYGRRSR